MGKVKLKILPRPGLLSAQMRPSCCSTRCRATATPRPVPPGSPFFVSGVPRVRAIYFIEALEDARQVFFADCKLQNSVS
jgi:hypothetical protein